MQEQAYLGQEKEEQPGHPAADGDTWISALSLLDAMEDFVRVVDPDGTIIYKNRALSAFEKQCRGKGMKNPIFPPSSITRPFKKRIDSTEKIHVDGRAFSIKSSPLFLKEDVQAVIEVFRDFTVQDDLTRRVMESNRRLRNEMNLARSIQTKMLPQMTNEGSFVFDSRYIPSEELSGDFYDVVPLADGRLAVYISDVAGHGISASILTMFVRQTMRGILLEESVGDPEAVLLAMRTRFQQIHMEDSQYFTLFYGVFDMRKNTFTYANAGHNCEPIVAQNGEARLLKAKGKIISPVFLAKSYEEKILPLQEGQSFLFYTDGASEAVNIQGEVYSMERMLRWMEKEDQNRLQHMTNDLMRFTEGTPRDDIALLEVRYLGNEKGMK